MEAAAGRGERIFCARPLGQHSIAATGRAVKYVTKAVAQQKKEDRGGVLVFGTEASLESTVNEIVKLDKVTAVVGTERTDLAAAIRLGTAAFPETGQKRLVVLSDGNENIGDAMAAAAAAKPLGVSIDVVPLGVERGTMFRCKSSVCRAASKKGRRSKPKFSCKLTGRRTRRCGFIGTTNRWVNKRWK